MHHSIDPHSVKSAHEAGKIHLVDVRSPVEFGELHIAGSQSVPLERLDPEKVREEAAGRPCVLVCRSGKRAEQARQKLASAGCSPLAVLEGGVIAWEAAGLPVSRGRSVVSLERQVRIAAGLLVLAGVTLGATVHPALFGMSAFVGAGLVFAGVTDWCGMGLMLARMPWNQKAD